MGFGQDTLAHERLLRNDPRSILGHQSTADRGVILTSLADLASRDIRDASGHVQVITARQIEASGARTLLDVLHLVPGLSFGHWGGGMAGTHVHGNWNDAQGVQFLLNGTPMNDPDRGSASIGERIPLIHVERIEVLLGQGSFQYGGYASMGVVNIVTWDADQGTGARAEARMGLTANGLTRTGASVAGAHRLGRDQDIGYVFAQTRGQRSNAVTHLAGDTPVSYRDSTAFRTSAMGFHYRWKGLRAFVNYFDENALESTGAYRRAMRDLLMGAEQRLAFSEKVQLHWSLTHATQTPVWEVSGQPSGGSTHERTNGTVLIGVSPYKWLSFWSGVQAWHHHWHMNPLQPDSILFRINGERSVNMNGLSLLGDLRIHGRAGSFTAGYRLERNDRSGPAAAPRLAYTKTHRNLHIKLLWSHGFRHPTLMDLELAAPLVATQLQQTTTTEAELGYRTGKGARLTVNGYHTRIEAPPIVSGDDGTVAERPVMGTMGVDARFAYANERWNLLAGGGWNQALAGGYALGSVVDEQTGRWYQAAPSARAFATIAWDATNWLSVRARGHWREASSTTARGHITEYPAETILFAGITVRPAKGRATLEMGCENLLDAERTLPASAPIEPGPFMLNGRTWTMAIIYRFVQ